MNIEIDQLLQSTEPSIRYQARLHLQDRPAEENELRALQQLIRSSARVKALLSERNAEGQIPCHPYKKWYGAHWVLVSLAELHYPPGDLGLVPLREQVLGWLFSEQHTRHYLTLHGRMRRCASQESNAMFSLLSLGLADDRVDELARRLLQWQWPDGGWNCDRRPDVARSSFMETITPLRALDLYARVTGSSQARIAVEHAAEVFLKRRLFKRQSDGQVIDPDFLLLHFPLYWHYDVLFALGILAEAGYLPDERCREALEHLKKQQLKTGGFPAQAKYYKPANQANPTPIAGRTSGYSLVDWGPTGKTRVNEFVTVNALAVLRRAGIT